MLRLILLLAVIITPSLAFAQDKVLSPTLTLDQAIDWALKQSPALAASRSRLDSAAAGRSQAGALPNPELSVEVENIYGDGPYKGAHAAEVTYRVAQLVELPGKRSSRVSMAKSEQVRTHYERDAATLDLIKDVTVAYAELAAAQEELTILGEERSLAEEVRNSVAAKVEAGKEPPIQKNKAEIELSSSVIALDRVRRTLVVKKEVLNNLLGGAAEDFKVAPATLPVLQEPESFDYYRSRLQQSPDSKKYGAAIANAESVISLERANALPDPTLSFGVRQFNEDNNHALVAGVSLPIPVFNRNRSAIAKASHELNAVKMDKQQAGLSLEAELAKAHGDWSNSFATVNSLKTAVLPGAEEAFDYARGGYKAGKFGYLDVLDAQRTLFSIRKQLNDAVLDYQRQKATVERLAALHVLKYAENKE